jgi:hypothetical protein
MSFCGKCGNKLNEDAKFCPKCGKQLTTQSHIESAPAHVPVQNQNYASQQNNFSPVVKKKSRKGLWVSVFILFVLVGAGVFFMYKYFLSGPEKMTAEYKMPEASKLIKLDSGGIAPANMFGIMLKEGYGKDDAKEIAKLINGKVVGEIELNNVYQIEFAGKTKEDLNTAIDKVKTSDKVSFAFPDGALSFNGDENSSCNPLGDSFYDGDDSKPYEMINLKKAWDIIKASGVKLNDVIVGVVDTDINYDSDELKNGKSDIVPILRKDMNDSNKLTHGTMVTGVLAANIENGGMSGVASVLGDKLQVNTTTLGDISWTEIKKKDANKDDISEYDASELGYAKSIFAVEAMKNIQKQIDNGATIINCSFSNHLEEYDSQQNEYFSKVYKLLLENTQKKYPNVIIVGTAGNDGRYLSNNKIWSHKLDNLVTVGAVNRDKSLAYYSNVVDKNDNNEVTVVACGDVKMEDGKTHSGTSFAAPQVTGLIALLRSIDPKLTPAEIKKILTGTAKEIKEQDALIQGYDQKLIQADDAVLHVIEKVTGKKFDKNKLLAMSKVELKSDGSSPEFTITATVDAVGEKGTSLQMKCSGGDYAFGDKVKTLSAPGSVNWSLTAPEKDKKLTVKVTRLDTKACKTILVGGETKDLGIKRFEGKYEANYHLSARTTLYTGNLLASSKNKISFDVNSNGKFIINLKENLKDEKGNIYPVSINLDAQLIDNPNDPKGDLFYVTGKMQVNTAIFDNFAKQKPKGPVDFEGNGKINKKSNIITIESRGIWEVHGKNGFLGADPNDEDSGSQDGSIVLNIQAERKSK